MKVAIAVAVGSVAGLIVSSWQGFKDPPWEGFSLGKFFRSIVIGAAAGAVFAYADARGAIPIDNFGILAFAVVAVERVAGEAYKGFLRKGAHDEYYKLLGRMRVPVHAYCLKAMLGIGFVAGAYGLFRLLAWWLDRLVGISAGLSVPGLVIGAAGGLLVAIGGALKDSQFEGFIPAKFVRSPIVGALMGMIMIYYSRTWFLVVLAAIGGERVGVEFYKTFLRRQVRGMHNNKPVRYPMWLAKRGYFAISYGLAVAACVFLLVTMRSMR